MTFIETNQSIGERSKLTVRHKEGGTEITVIPEMGARLNSFLVNLHGESLNIIDGFSDEELLEGKISSKGALLAPFPNRIADGKYEWRGQEYQLEINREQENNAIHGFVSDKVFTLESSKAVDDYYELVFQYASEGVPGYPFPFAMTVTYRFGGVWLEVATEITNTGKTALPAGFGWHPYFRMSDSIDSLQLTLPKVEKIEVDERLIPTGKVTDYEDYSKPAWVGGVDLDTGFRLLGTEREVQLYDTAHGLSVVVSLDGEGNAYEYLQVYTPSHRRSVAIEPMTCAANAFNNDLGLAKLKPQDSLKAHFTILVS